MLANLTCDEIREVVLEHIATSPWTGPVFVKVAERIYISVGTGQRHNRSDEPRFSANVIDGVFYLLAIELPRSLRGQGHGSRLYEALVKIASELGCSRIEQTPSGWSPNGETRAHWLERRGWIINDDGTAHKVLPR